MLERGETRLIPGCWELIPAPLDVAPVGASWSFALTPWKMERMGESCGGIQGPTWEDALVSAHGVISVVEAFLLAL